MGNQKLAHIALVVKDYDEAILFYTKKLNFSLIMNTRLTDKKRWVVVAPPGSSECTILLAKAADDMQISRIGNQTGGRVFLFLYTDNFQEDFHRLIENGVEIIRQPSKEEYGTVAVFADLYGNLWDIIEPSR
jgi:catechol 2,3-dioxygenase-like lactoylglutathione lyase family enzyme